MTIPLPGKQWVPSNGSEGSAFLCQWCSNCARDRSMRDGVPEEECDEDELCQIIAASFRGEATEWRELPDERVLCVSFVAAGSPVAPPRCSHTCDLFDPAPSTEAA